MDDIQRSVSDSTGSCSLRSVALLHQGKARDPITSIGIAICSGDVLYVSTVLRLLVVVSANLYCLLMPGKNSRGTYKFTEA